MKVLILSCSTGGGHNCAAAAIKEQFDNAGIGCDIVDMHSLINPKRTRKASNFYSFVALHLSRLFGAVYNLAGAISHPGGHSPIYFSNIKYAKPIYEYIKKNGVDTVICTHLFPAEAMTRLRRKYDGKIKFYFAATDYTCSPFNEETVPDLFFIPHKDLADEYRGLDDSQKVATGIPVFEKFKNIDRDVAREFAKIPEGKGHILFMSGSMGFGKVWTTLRSIRSELGEKYEYTVLGGHNSVLKKKLYKIWGKDVHIVDFTDMADMYIGSADVIFTKPGGLTTTESAVAGIPIVHTKPIPGCETKNENFFANKGMSVIYKGKKDMPAVLSLIKDSEKQRIMVEAQRANINPDAAHAIYETVIKTA